MKWFQRAKQTSPTRERRFLPISVDGIVSALVRRQETLVRKYSTDPEANALVTRTLSIVDTCAMMNARACASTTIRLYRRQSGDRVPRGTRAVPVARRKMLASGAMGYKAANFVESGEFVEVTDHPALTFVRSPNPYFGEMFNVAAFYWREITGEFYSIVTNDESGPLQWPGYPQFTMPVFSKFGILQGVYFGRDQTDVVEVSADQVIYYRSRMARNNPTRGEGVIASQLPDIDQIIKTQIAAVAFLDNAQVPPGMLSISQDIPLQESQMEAIYDHLAEWRMGGRREGMPFVGQNVSWVPITSTPKDLRTIEQIKESERRVFQAFGIPDAIREGNASTFASALVADAQYGKLTILPRLIVDADQKTNFILPMFDLDPDDWCFVYDNPVPRDEQTEWGVKSSATGSALLTINEAREEMGYDKSPDPLADRLLYQGRPLDSIANPPDPFGGLLRRPPPSAGGQNDQPDPEPDPSPPSPPGSPADAPEDDPEEAKSVDLSGVVLKAAMEAEGEGWKHTDCACCKGVGEYPAGVVADLDRRYGNEFVRGMEPILRAAQTELLRALWDRDLPDLTIMRNDLESYLSENIQQFALETMRRELTGAGALADAFGVVDERAIEYARTYSIRLAGDIMGTTADIAKAAVERGLQEGLSIRQVQDAMEGVPAYRAEMIARTELSRASNGASWELAKELGATSSEWIVGGGACPLCVELGSKGKVPMPQPYATPGQTVGGVTVKSMIYHPPAHPNDRCVLIFNYPEGDE